MATKILLNQIQQSGATNGQVPVYNSTSGFYEPGSSPSGTSTWGAITGTLSSQTDLQTALNLKVPKANIELNVLDYGAVGDGKVISGVAIANGSTTLTSTVGTFTAGDVGKTIVYYNPTDFTTKASGASTIASFVSSTQVTLTVASSTTSITSGSGWACYGTDDSTAFATAFTAAQALYTTDISTDPNIPFGGGQPIVVAPHYNSKGNYVLGSSLSIPDGCGFDSVSKLHNAMADRTATFITAGKFNIIKNLYAYCKWGGGVTLSTFADRALQTHTYVGTMEIWNSVGTGLEINGYNFNIKSLFIKECVTGIRHQSGSDCVVDRAELIGCTTGVIMRGSNQVFYPALQLDTCGGTGTLGGVVFDNVASACSNIRINLTSFCVTGTTQSMSPAVNFTNNSSNIHSNIFVTGNINNTGGSMLAMNRMQECEVLLNGSNYVGASDGTNAITTGVVFGTGNSGVNRVHLNLAAAITPYTGTIYHGFSYYQSSVLYRAGEKIAEDNTVGSENLRLRTQTPIRFYDADNTNYVAFKAGTTVSSNITWTLPSADGSNGQVLSTNGSGTLSWVASGTVTLSVTAKTANYTITTSDDVINCDTSGGAFTLTLPAPASLTKVLRIKITSTSSNTVTITPPSGTIDGGANYVIQNPTLKPAIVIVSDSTNFQVH